MDKAILEQIKGANETFHATAMTIPGGPGASNAVTLPDEFLLRRFEAFLGETARGKGYWDAYSQNRVYLRHIFEHVPRLAVAWRRLPVGQMADALCEAMLDPDTVIPMKLGSRDTEEVMCDLYDALGRYLQKNHQPLLQQQAASFCRLVCGNIGNTWSNALHGREMTRAPRTRH